MEVPFFALAGCLDKVVRPVKKIISVDERSEYPYEDEEHWRYRVATQLTDEQLSEFLATGKVDQWN